MSVRLENDVGCKYNITFNATDSTDYNYWELGSWSDLDSYVVKNRYAETTYVFGFQGVPLKPTYNDKCRGHQAMIMSSPWVNPDWSLYASNDSASFPSNFTVSGYMCESFHTMANIPVRVSTSASDFYIEIDTAVFQRGQKEVPAAVLNTPKFITAYTDPYWYMIIPKLNMGRAIPSGAMALLATHYKMDFYKMKNGSKLPVLAARVQRRHFG